MSNPFRPKLPAPGEHAVDPSLRHSTVNQRPRYRRSRRSHFVTGDEPPQEGIGPFNLVPPGYKPRVRRYNWPGE